MAEEMTLKRIDELLPFLPLFRRPGREFVDGWYGGERNDECQEWWPDGGYQPAEAAAVLRDDEAIRGATLGQVRTMLTWCVRSERFCDGHWESLLKAGRIAALLDRLVVLRAELARR